jgi:hypothetical protein
MMLSIYKSCGSSGIHALSFEHLLEWTDNIRFTFEDKTTVADSLLNYLSCC